MADVVFNNFKKLLLSGSINLASDTIKVILVDSSYAPDADNHKVYDDVKSYEITGTGYTTGGKELSNKVVNEDDAHDYAVFDADDVTWSDSTITARGAILYKDTGASTTSPLIAYFDFGGEKSSSNGDFTIQWGSAGILTLGG